MSEELLETPAESNAATHLFLFICVAACIAFGVWAWQGSLAVVSVAIGEVVTSSQVKTIQHLEGGIVREIKVREGERVKTGQALVVLESTATGADVGELKTRIVGLQIEVARLEAAAANATKPTFPVAIIKSHPRQIREAIQLFDSSNKRLKDEFASQQDIQEISARIKSQRNSLKLQNEQIKISIELLKD